MKLNNNQMKWARYVAAIAGCRLSDVLEIEAIHQLSINVFIDDHCIDLEESEIYKIKRALSSIALDRPCPF